MTDIVERLEDWSNQNMLDLIADAKAEIERLRAEREELFAERHAFVLKYDRLQAEIERLREQKQ